MTREEMVSEIVQATESVFTTMLGTEVTAGEFSLEESTPGPSEGVVSLIGLAGVWSGTGSLSCSPETACKLCAKLLLTEFGAVNEDVLDAIAELTNMIIGNFKTAMEDRLGPMGLSIPTVIFGRNFTTRSAKKDWTVIPFESDCGRIDVHFCVAPTDKKPQLTGYRICKQARPVGR